MQAANAQDASRRSSRVPVTVPVLVTSLAPDSHFSEVCETLVVNAHGCAMRSPMRLEAGAPVHFQSKQGRRTMAHIVDCQPMGLGQQGWKLAAKLDQPDNFWGLQACPDDWARPPAGGNGAADRLPNHAPLSSRPAPDKTPRRLPDDHLNAVVAEIVQPLQAEIRELREKLSRGEPKRSQFEISLTHIPPEVEEKLWVRLRQDLGAQVLQQTREQSEQLLGAANESIETKIIEAQNEFREQLAEELKAVEQRAQRLSEEITDAVQQHLHSGEERFQHRVSEAGTGLAQRSEELLAGLRQRLSEEHDAHRREMHRVQAEVAAESSRLQVQTAELGSRIARLDESAHRLESDLDAHLARMASEIISGARVQLDRAVDVVLKELSTRNAKELEHQLDEARGQLKTVQKGIEARVTELLRTQVAGSLLSFGQTMEELAQDSVGRWRLALGRDLNSVAKILGQPFRMDAAPDRSEEPAAD